MGKPQRRKGTPAKNKFFNRNLKTKKFTKMDDQIYDDLNNENKLKKLVNQEFNDELPGLGQYYCVSCAKYMINSIAQVAHNKTKNHKRQLRKLQSEKPYNVKEAEMYAK